MADANADHAADEATKDTETGGGTGDPTPEEQIAKLTGDLGTSQAKEKELASKLGKQSEQIGTLKGFADEMTNDPKGLIGRIADGAGIKVNYDTKPLVAAELAGIEPEQVGKLVQDISAGVKAELEPTVKGAQDANKAFQEQMLANRYSDFDDRTPERDALQLAVTSGTMSDTELRHLAARGSTMDSTIAAAIQKGGDDKLAELNKKAEEQISGGGKTSKDKGKGHTAEEAVARLSGIRGA
jgi:hypothetical protein